MLGTVKKGFLICGWGKLGKLFRIDDSEAESQSFHRSQVEGMWQKMRLRGASGSEPDFPQDLKLFCMAGVALSRDQMMPAHPPGSNTSAEKAPTSHL
jgi:hypothetical protein